MKVELEFLDSAGVRVHERELVYPSGVPIPDVGEVVLIAGEEMNTMRVARREFFYLAGTGNRPDVKVTFWCDEAKA